MTEVEISNKPNVKKFFLAIYDNNVEVVESMLNHNMVSVNARNLSSETALFFVKSIEMAKLLLSFGAKPNVINKSNFTPLNYACVNAHIDIAKLLIDNGAKVNMPNCYPVLFSAVNSNNLSMVEFIVKQNIDINVTFNKDTVLGLVRDINILKLLLNNGIDYTKNNYFNIPPVLSFISSPFNNNLNDNELFYCLLPLCSDIDKLYTNSHNVSTSLLHTAVVFKNIPALHTLISLGADLSLKNRDGRTPIESSVEPEINILISNILEHPHLQFDMMLNYSHHIIDNIISYKFDINPNYDRKTNTELIDLCTKFKNSLSDNDIFKDLTFDEKFKRLKKIIYRLNNIYYSPSNNIKKDTSILITFGYNQFKVPPIIPDSYSRVKNPNTIINSQILYDQILPKLYLYLNTHMDKNLYHTYSFNYERDLDAINTEFCNLKDTRIIGYSYDKNISHYKNLKEIYNSDTKDKSLTKNKRHKSITCEIL